MTIKAKYQQHKKDSAQFRVLFVYRLINGYINGSTIKVKKEKPFSVLPRLLTQSLFFLRFYPNYLHRAFSICGFTPTIDTKQKFKNIYNTIICLYIDKIIPKNKKIQTYVRTGEQNILLHPEN